VCGFTASLFILASDAAGAAPYADFVLDANSGNVLHETNADARRHPASLTKIMTLYLLFEQLEAGKLKLDSQMNVSKEAASQSPTKLGLKPGSTLAVEDAIKGMVTRSANDAAVVVAEAIAGDEDDFAKLMTRKAHALGMSRTTYKNASGLPNDDQVTTTRDQATLGRAIQERFPRYYKYFSTRSFNFRGQSIGNHNHLLGRVEGVDGIKTGYISASGFNLVTSVHRGNRYLVAVVMGGSSAGSRDSRMRELINEKIARAATQRTTSVIAEASQPPEARAEPKVVGRSEAKSDAKSEAKTERKSQAKRLAKADAKTESKPQTNIAENKPDQTAEPIAEPRFSVASATSVPASLSRSPAQTEPGGARTESATAASVAQTVIGSTEPIRPVLVRTLTVRAGTPTAPVAPALQVSSPLPPQPAEPAEIPTWPPATIVTPDPAPAPAPRPTTASPRRAGTADQAPTAPPAATVPAAPAPAPAPTPVAAVVPTPAPITPAAVSAPTPPAAAAPVVAAPAPERSAPLQSTPRQAAVAPAPKPQTRSGWIIQVGAYHAEEEAKQRLSSVRSKASKMLTGADPFTETFDKGGTTYYRARFVGLDKDKAEAACKYLKKNDVECVAMKN
jgi:D-alanyl-D-alanine carboxypeptidase